MRAQTRTQTHTQARMETPTQISTHTHTTQTQKNTYNHTLTHTHKRKRTQTHTHTHARTQHKHEKHVQPHAHTYAQFRFVFEKASLKAFEMAAHRLGRCMVCCAGVVEERARPAQLVIALHNHAARRTVAQAENCTCCQMFVSKCLCKTLRNL